MKKLNLQNLSRPEAFQTTISRKVRAKALKIAKNFKGNILDIGCGNGLLMLELLDGNGENDCVFGIDYDFNILLEGSTIFKDNAINSNRFIYCDAFQSPLRNKSFDMIFCLNTFMNIDSIKTIYKLIFEMYRICNDRGKIIFDFRNSDNPLLRRKYIQSAENKGLEIYSYRRTDFYSIVEKLKPKKINFIPIGLPIQFLTLGYIAVMEK